MKFPKQLLTEIAAHLEEEKQKVTAQVKDLKIQDPFSDTDRLVDNAATDTEAKEETDHERYQAMLEELQLKLEEIETALQRIKKGSYGFCRNCKKMIDTERLAAIPTAALCMDCEAKKKH